MAFLAESVRLGASNLTHAAIHSLQVDIRIVLTLKLNNVKDSSICMFQSDVREPVLLDGSGEQRLLLGGSFDPHHPHQHLLPRQRRQSHQVSFTLFGL